MQRQAKREDRTLADAELPRLWILSPSACKRLRNGFRLQEGLKHWIPGIYFWGEFERAAIVAINQLPPTPDTLWVRLLGKGVTQEREFKRLLERLSDKLDEAEKERIRKETELLSKINALEARLNALSEQALHATAKEAAIQVFEKWRLNREEIPLLPVCRRQKSCLRHQENSLVLVVLLATTSLGNANQIRCKYSIGAIPCDCLDSLWT